jgi:arylsulfatase
MDNFGYGELGVYGGGITRGGATPRIDKLAGEGLRLTNFNVEAQCTPSRAALMTGRYAKRTGNASVPWLTGLYGLTQWEVTMAEMLAEVGYATGIFGKWHLGHTPGRFPTDQGFDEWYGIPNSTDESYWPGQEQFNRAALEGTVPYLEMEYILKGSRGSVPEKVKRYDLPARREIDREITDYTKAFIKRQAKAGKPFFAYVPYTQTHMPVLPSAAFKGKSGNGNWGDVLMQIDAYVGELLDMLDQLDIADNTIFIFTADNGPEMLPENHGWSGPWSGSYFTAKEGSLRVPFIVRWPGKVPAGRVSNEIVHQMDLFTTLAKIAGGRVPDDRIIDGIDQGDFFTGNSEKSARDGFVVYVGEDIFGAKWRNWKMLTKEFDDARGTGRIVEYGVPRFYDLYNDPQEAYAITMKLPEHLWVRWPMAQILREHLASLKKEPPIKAGTPDPYTPTKYADDSSGT